MTRTNTATAVEIAKRISALIQLLNDTVDSIKAEIQRLDVGETRKRVEQINKPTQFDKVIRELGYQFVYPDPLSFAYDMPQKRN